jgi:hypothetical protein
MSYYNGKKQLETMLRWKATEKGKGDSKVIIGVAALVLVLHQTLGGFEVSVNHFLDK